MSFEEKLLDTAMEATGDDSIIDVAEFQPKGTAGTMVAGAMAGSAVGGAAELSPQQSNGRTASARPPPPRYRSRDGVGLNRVRPSRGLDRRSVGWVRRFLVRQMPYAVRE